MTNIFAFRSTDPNIMKYASDPVGPDNDAWLAQSRSISSVAIAAWGVHGEFLDRAAEVAKLLPELHCLGTTKNGSPRHPLYLKADCRLHPWPT